MRFIPTRIHGILDYVVGIALIAAPWIFGFADVGGAAMWIPIILGIGLIIYSLLTDYEYRVVKAIPMPAHLALDGIAGLFLAASPWLFGFADEEWNVWVPHLVVGLVVIAVALTTQTRPAYELVEGERRRMGA